jgi:hypothetical protein
MATSLYVAKIKLPHCAIQEVTVRADNFFNAKAMIEAQFGKGCLFTPPTKVG